jgi:integrase
VPLTDEDDLVFCGIVGGHLDGSALSKRYRAVLERAALRPLRFHDLRHTFGTRVTVDGLRPSQRRVGSSRSRASARARGAR